MASNENAGVDRLITFGKMALEQGWYDKARENFERALALDPSNREAMKGLARVNEILSRREAIAAKPIQVKSVKPPGKVQKTTAGKAMYAIAAIVVVAVVVMMLRAVYTHFAPSSTEPTTKAMLTTTAMPTPITSAPTLVEATFTPKPVEATYTPITPNPTPALTEPSFIEPIRRQIFRELVDASGNNLMSEEAHKEIAERWLITVDTVEEIALEGIEKGWPMSTATPIPPTHPPQPTPVPQPARRHCCKICTTGKACGDSCIAINKTCHKPPGCACNGY